MINTVSNIKFYTNTNFTGYLQNHLDKYKLSDFQRKRIEGFESAYEYIDDSDTALDNYNKLSKESIGCWLENIPLNEDKCAWKLFVYADNVKDYNLLYAILSQYILDNDIMAKIIEPYYFDKLNNDEKERGKAFVFYPKSISDFKKIATELDYIIKINHLEAADTDIIGTKNLGKTGRLFYRYEYKSKQYKDLILNFKNSRDYAFYCKYYEKARDNTYLASDMIDTDDPFLNML